MSRLDPSPEEFLLEEYRCPCFVPDTLALSGFGGLRASDQAQIVDRGGSDGNESHPLRHL
jgi:hypothetical protein